MRQVTTAGNRFRQAHGLPAVLDAACDAFEAILTVIGDYEDTTSTGTAFTFLLVATQAANGRDALLFAPSLPPRALHPMAAAGEPDGQGSETVIKSSAAGVSELLATGLARTATTITNGADRAACRDAATCAARITDLLAGAGP
jgi:hypothetical protein